TKSGPCLIPSRTRSSGLPSRLWTSCSAVELLLAALVVLAAKAAGEGSRAANPDPAFNQEAATRARPQRQHRSGHPRPHSAAVAARVEVSVGFWEVPVGLDRVPQCRLDFQARHSAPPQQRLVRQLRMIGNAGIGTSLSSC